ncbi:MAG TPA: tetratricopeptide repeat protein [Candidatus Polarisedimenticolia bacterium]|nr:tetratricopeptide repeat protein [Candidatus Polarisedimenticolia bacterium]
MVCPACGRDNLAGAGRCSACFRLLPETTSGGAGSPPPPVTGASAGGPASEAPTDPGLAAPTSGGLPAGATGVTSLTGAPSSGGASPRIAPGTLIGSRYLIEAVLGEGGMGVVYRARDRELNRTVALKVIRPELTSHPEILERFKREILLASQVTHKNVVRIHDLGETGDLRFLSMSYIEGESLRSLIDREGALSPERGVPILRGILSALQAAHEAGVVHRDLKPHNVLVDKDDQPYVGDFGISRSMTAGGGTMTETGAILGTVDYMSPEQARGDVPDHRSDIYSLGVMMFEMFTGSLPFHAANPLSVMVKRVHEDAPSPTRIRPGMPPWLSAIITRALVRDPKVRYQSVTEVLRDIDRQRASRAKRQLLGKRTLVAAAGIVLAGLLVLGTQRFLASRVVAAPPVKSSLALLPFRNETGDAKLDWVPAGLTSVLRSGLLQARALRLAGDDRVGEILDVLKPAPGEEARPANAQRLGRLAGVDHVLAGSVVRMGDRLRLQASLIPIGEDGAGTARDIVVDGEPGRGADGDQAALLGMIDRLTREVRTALGVARSWGEEEHLAAQLSSKSVEALSLYGEGLSLRSAGKTDEAAEKLNAAVKKDPDFAVAWALLAETEDERGRAEPAKAAAQSAVAHLAEASPWEAARIRATHARITGDLAGAESSYQSLVDAAPNDPQSLLDLAGVQEEAGDLAGARKSLERAVALDPKSPGAQFALGRILARSGESTDAAQALNKALLLFGELGSDAGRARALNGLGNVALDLGQHEEAEHQFQQAIDIRRRIGDQRGVAVGLGNLALTAARRGRMDDAIKLEKDSIAAARTLGDPGVEAKGLLDLGDILQKAGRTDEALATYQDSLRILREAGDENQTAKVLSSLGYLNATLGKYVEAFFFMKEALAKARAIGEQTNLVRTLGDIGGLEQVQGRYDEALRYFDEGLRLARQVDNKGAAIALQMNTAQVHEAQGEYGPALELLGEAEKAARDAREASYLSPVLTYLGSVRMRSGDLAGSAKVLTEAIALCRDQSNDALLAEALVYDGERRLAQDDRSAAATLKEAVAAATRAGDYRVQRMARLALARAEKSPRDLQAVLKDARASGLAPLVAPALASLAAIDLQANHLDEAAARAHEAADSATRLKERDWIVQARRIEGSALLRQGKSEPAAAAFRQALAPFEEMRSGLSGPALAAFLARPETAALGRDATAALAAVPADHDKLLALLRP